jgi:hypothetical protein
VEDKVLSQSQIDSITDAFVKGRILRNKEMPDAEEIESLLSWFNEVTRGATLMQWVLDGLLSLDMTENVIAFIENSIEKDISPSVLRQIESLDTKGMDRHNDFDD